MADSAAVPPAPGRTLKSALPAYAELQCATNFTFLRGASHAEELVERASALGYSALAITDECSVAGVVRAHCAAKTQKLHLIIGSYFTLVQHDQAPAVSLILLAQNRDGYGNLCELITHGRTHAEKGSYLLKLHDLDAPPSNIGHLKGMPDCLAILVPKYGDSVERVGE